MRAAGGQPWLNRPVADEGCASPGVFCQPCCCPLAVCLQKCVWKVPTPTWRRHRQCQELLCRGRPAPGIGIVSHLTVRSCEIRAATP